MRHLVLILLACFASGVSSARAAGGTDPGDIFVNAYMSVQAADKAEQAGTFKTALTKFRQAATMLDQISTNHPNWQPQIVAFRKQRTAESITRVQDKIARSGGGGGGPSSGGGGALDVPPSPLPTVSLPGDENEKPLIFQDSPESLPAPGGRAPASNAGRTSPRKSQPDRNADVDPVEAVQQRMKQLQTDLESAREEAKKLEKEKGELAAKLSEAAKARQASEERQQVLQNRSDNAEQALKKAMTDGKSDLDKVKTLQTEMASAKKALRDMKIEAEADAEYRQQLDDQYKSALGKIERLTRERDVAKEASTDVPGKIAKIQQDLDRTKKERDDLQVKLQKTEGQLVVVQQQRDDALSQVTKLKEAQKQVDKLVADNATLMGKLADAEKSITQFKTEGVQKDQEIAALKKEVGDVKVQLAAAKKESADYQRQMADLQGKLEDAGKQLAQAKADNAASVAERTKMQQENSILRGIVLRQQKEEAMRAKTRKMLLAEMADLEINSKTLLKQIDLLSQPVVKLTEKERALFKNPELQVSDTEISFGVVAKEEPIAEPVAPILTAPAVPTVASVVPPAPLSVPPAPAPLSVPPATAPLATATTIPTATRPTSTPVAAAPALTIPKSTTTVSAPPAATPKSTTTASAAPATPARVPVPPPVAPLANTIVIPAPSNGVKPAATPATVASAKPVETIPAPAPTRIAEPALPEKPLLTLDTKPTEGLKPLALNTQSNALSLETKTPPPAEAKRTTTPGVMPPNPDELPNLNTEKPASTPPENSLSAASETTGSAGGMTSTGAPNVPAELMPLAREGKDFFERGNYIEAEKTYRKILARTPNNLYTLSNLGVVLFRAGKYKAAEDSFKKAIAIAPEDGFSHCTLGIVFYSQTKYDDAVNELTKALAINPKNATAHNYLGITASQKGWQEAAQKELETAVGLDPTYADAHFNLAVVYAMQTPPNKEKAREHYKKATEYGAEADSALEQMIKGP